MTKPLSLRAYAAWRKERGLRGGNLQAVQKAIKSGRVADAVIVVDGVKKIADPELADREWATNADPSRMGVIGFRGDDDAEEHGEPPEIVKASTRLKQAQAATAELNLQLRAGLLMNVEEAEEEWSGFCAMARTKVLGVTSKLKQLRPQLSLDDLATLDSLLREALEELAGADDPDDDETS